jgi:hypothetical protein
MLYLREREREREKPVKYGMRQKMNKHKTWFKKRRRREEAMTRITALHFEERKK